MFARHEIVLANPEILRRRLRAAGEDCVVHERGLSDPRESNVLRLGQFITLTIVWVLNLLHDASFLKQVEPLSTI